MDTQQTVKTEKNNTVKKSSKRDYVYAIGRQREAVARVRLYAHIKEDAKWGDQLIKKEQILVTAKPIEHYFFGSAAKKQYTKPLQILNVLNKYAITIKVSGGGNNGQL